jgi:hypothetical protein
MGLFGWVFVEVGLLGYGSVAVSLCDAIEVVTCEEMSLLPVY